MIGGSDSVARFPVVIPAEAGMTASLEPKKHFRHPNDNTLFSTILGLE